MDKPSKTAKRRDRRSFTPEFKAEVVRLCKAGDRSKCFIGVMSDDRGHCTSRKKNRRKHNQHRGLRVHRRKALHGDLRG